MIQIGGRHSGAEINDKYGIYNGVPVKWFVGDKNFGENYWHCHASANGKMYQLHGTLKDGGSDIENISVNSDKGSYYFDEVTFNLLTK